FNWCVRIKQVNRYISNFTINIHPQLLSMMLPKQKLTSTNAYKELSAHFGRIKDIHLKDLFNDNDRFERFSISWGDILFDYSKNRITEETHELLIRLAAECGLQEAITAMFGGEKINETENTAVLHTALRNPAQSGIIVDGKDIMPDIHEVLAKMETFSNQVISGEWKGYTGKAIEHIINIGIGGSDLGPVMVTEALKP